MPVFAGAPIDYYGAVVWPYPQQQPPSSTNNTELSGARL
jgi:hypothetical protein